MISLRFYCICTHKDKRENKMVENRNWNNKNKDKTHTPQNFGHFSAHNKKTTDVSCFNFKSNGCNECSELEYNQHSYYNYYKINNLTTYLTRNVQQNIVQQLLQGSTELDKHFSI